MTPEITAAIQEIQTSFPDCRIDTSDDGSGGAFVIVHDTPIAGGPYEQDTTWIGFHITHTYPYCDIYPHFVRPDLSRSDGKKFGEGLSLGTYRDKQAVQVSRKAKRHNPATDTAVLKLLKVLRWLTSD